MADKLQIKCLSFIYCTMIEIKRIMINTQQNCEMLYEQNVGLHSQQVYKIISKRGKQIFQ